MLIGPCGAAFSAAAVAWTPVVSEGSDSSRLDAAEEDVAAGATESWSEDAAEEDVASVVLALVDGETVDDGAALDVVEETDEELGAGGVTALCTAGTTLELVIGDDAALETGADETTVCKVVAGTAAGLAAVALFGNDPSPQRHEHAQEPSALRVPVPFAMAPGEPTAGCAARIRLVNAWD